MIDANSDYNNIKDPGRDLATFIRDSHLVDHYHEEYPEQTIQTYMYGSKRLDYIMCDPSLVPAIKNIGYLGTHDNQAHTIREQCKSYEECHGQDQP